MAHPPDDLESPFADPAAKLNPPVSNASESHSQEKPQVETAALSDYNPFETGAADLSGNINTAEYPPPYSTFEAQRVTAAELERRQKELDAKAAELARREEEQNRLAEQARRGNGQGPPNNWPPLPSFFPCKPCFYQDIDLEIIPEYQPVVKFGYYLWIAYAALLLVNLLGSLVYFAGTSKADSGSVFGVAILVCVLFTPLSFICWFRPLYKAFRSNSSVNFFVFFFIFGAQILVMGIQSLGIFNWGSCGWIIGLSAVKEFPACGAFILIIACIFTGLTVACAFYLIRVHRIYRSTGASFGKAKEEFARGMVSEPAVRAAAMETGLYGVRQATTPRN
ncbi:unnamed protein product [Calicophoron daubneyi]|uniref:Secretory carrier-associated membrane protein n=1 Tax=Calicophoron daubneyi TaxID=300641 RepID=A0AAV2T0H9_CALDB